MPKHDLIITITGPSSSGKTVLSHLLRDQGIEPLVSTTTRPPREGETQGVDYHFVTHQQFQDKLDRGEFIENVQYDQNRYGVCVQEAERAFGKGCPAVLVAEPEGVRQIKAFAEARGWQTLRVFVNNPIELLIDRMLQRFQQDTAHLAPSDPACIAKRKTHGKRIAQVVGFEQENWVKPALATDSPYNMVFSSFNDGNQAEVLDQVMQRVATLLGDTPTPVKRSRSP